MNYYAHGCRFVDRPYYLAGTAVPDWLRVSDKGVRVRSNRVAPFADGTDSPQAEVAAGILQHLADDDLFHGSAAFIQVSAQLTQMFKRSLPTGDNLRPSFLGHISTELILDALLISRQPQGLDRYYEAFLQIDPLVVQAAVNATTRDPAQQLAALIPLFHRERFLQDYAQPAGMWYRINQVLRRVKLPALPEETQQVLADAWPIVDHWSAKLLPYAWPA